MAATEVSSSVTELVRHAKGPIRSVNLFGNFLDHAALRGIFKSLRYHRQVTALDLGCMDDLQSAHADSLLDTQFGDEGAAEIAQHLVNLPNLQSLGLASRLSGSIVVL
jgi:hypothetical protein